MAVEISGKTTLVTGGGSGICLAFAGKLLQGGCNIVVADLALQVEEDALVSKSHPLVDNSTLRCDRFKRGRRAQRRGKRSS